MFLSCNAITDFTTLGLLLRFPFSLLTLSPSSFSLFFACLLAYVLGLVPMADDDDCWLDDKLLRERERELQEVSLNSGNNSTCVYLYSKLLADLLERKTNWRWRGWDQRGVWIWMHEKVKVLFLQPYYRYNLFMIIIMGFLFSFCSWTDEKWISYESELKCLCCPRWGFARIWWTFVGIILP